MHLSRVQRGARTRLLPPVTHAPSPHAEPVYLLLNPTTALLSDARPLSLTSPALLSLNYLLDELLHLTINASLGGPGAGSSAAGTVALGPLADSEVLTTERFKAGIIRVVGPLLGKNAVLEAELAIRELLRLGAPSMRGDAALRKSSFGAPTAEGQSSELALATSAQADDIFRSLRAFIQIISGLGGASISVWAGKGFLRRAHRLEADVLLAPHQSPALPLDPGRSRPISSPSRLPQPHHLPRPLTSPSSPRCTPSGA